MSQLPNPISGGFFEGFGVGDAFETAAATFLEKERIDAQAGSAGRQAEQDQLIEMPDNVDQRPNARPAQPRSTEVSSGGGQGASRNLVIGGIEVNRTAAMVAGGALIAAVVIGIAT